MSLTMYKHKPGPSGGETLTVTCFTCGTPSSKEWAQRVNSKPCSRDVAQPFYPFLLEIQNVPPGALFLEDSSTYLCAFCHALLEAQWRAYEGKKDPIPASQRKYVCHKFICAVCGVETYRKRVRALPFQEFPFLAKTRQPGSITLGNNPLAVVCLDCSETLWAQSAEYDRWGLPVHKRHFNWMARPPPPENSMEATVARLPSGETQLPRCPPTDPLVPPKTNEPMALPEAILPLKCERQRSNSLNIQIGRAPHYTPKYGQPIVPGLEGPIPGARPPAIPDKKSVAITRGLETLVRSGVGLDVGIMSVAPPVVTVAPMSLQSVTGFHRRTSPLYTISSVDDHSSWRPEGLRGRVPSSVEHSQQSGLRTIDSMLHPAYAHSWRYGLPSQYHPWILKNETMMVDEESSELSDSLDIGGNSLTRSGNLGPFWRLAESYRSSPPQSGNPYLREPNLTPPMQALAHNQAAMRPFLHPGRLDSPVPVPHISPTESQLSNSPQPRDPATSTSTLEITRRERETRVYKHRTTDDYEGDVKKRRKVESTKALDQSSRKTASKSSTDGRTVSLEMESDTGNSEKSKPPSSSYCLEVKKCDSSKRDVLLPKKRPWEPVVETENDESHFSPATGTSRASTPGSDSGSGKLKDHVVGRRSNSSKPCCSVSPKSGTSSPRTPSSASAIDLSTYTNSNDSTKRLRPVTDDEVCRPDVSVFPETNGHGSESEFRQTPDSEEEGKQRLYTLLNEKGCEEPSSCDIKKVMEYFIARENEARVALQRLKVQQFNFLVKIGLVHPSDKSQLVNGNKSALRHVFESSSLPVEKASILSSLGLNLTEIKSGLKKFETFPPPCLDNADDVSDRTDCDGQDVVDEGLPSANIPINYPKYIPKKSTNSGEGAETDLTKKPRETHPTKLNTLNNVKLVDQDVQKCCQKWQNETENLLEILKSSSTSESLSHNQNEAFVVAVEKINSAIQSLQEMCKSEALHGSAATL